MQITEKAIEGQLATSELAMLTDGTEVGESVGDSVGFGVGLVVGFFEGAGVGLPEGRAVVGSPVGPFEGDVVG